MGSWPEVEEGHFLSSVEADRLRRSQRPPVISGTFGFREQQVDRNPTQRQVSFCLRCSWGPFRVQGERARTLGLFPGSLAFLELGTKRCWGKMTSHKYELLSRRSKR